MEGKNVIGRYVEELCAKVKSRRQREALRQELYDHLEQKVEQLTGQGMDKAQAEQKAVEEMGDKKEVARELNRVHTYTPQSILRGVCYTVTIVAGVLTALMFYGFFPALYSTGVVSQTGEVINGPLLPGSIGAVGVIGGADGPEAIYVSSGFGSSGNGALLMLAVFVVLVVVSVVLLVKSSTNRTKQEPPKVQ